MKKNTASQVIGAQMVYAANGAAFTGSVTAYVTGDGGTQAAGSVGSGACTHEGNGYHTYAPAQAETNYDLIAFTFTGTSAVPVTVQVFTTFPQTGDTYAALPTNFSDLSVTANTGYVAIGSIPGTSATNTLNTSANAAIVAYNLDHLFKVAIANTDVTNNSAFAYITSKSATADFDDFDNTTDSLQAIRDNQPTLTDNPFVMVNTTITGLSSNTSFSLTSGSGDDDAYVGCLATINNAANTLQKCVVPISAYAGNTKTVTLAYDPGVFTIANTNQIAIGADLSLRPTTVGRTLDVTATGAAGVDWGNVENPTTSVSLTGTTISNTQVAASVTGSVGSVTGAVGSVTGNVGGNVTGSVGSISGVTFPTNFADLDITANTGYITLASTGLDQITPLSPSAVPAFNTATLPQWIAYFGLWSTAEVNVTANTVVVRNAADSADLATHSTSDNGTIFSSGAAS